MRSFIVLTFLFLAVGFYELSGGADFVPEVRPEAMQAAAAQPVAPSPQPATLPETVTRADADPLAGLDALPGVPERLAQPLVTPAEPVSQVSDEVVAEEAPVLASLATPLDAERFVAANALNLRAGPSTADRVLTRLVQNDRVTVLSDLGDGWALVRVSADGTEGWVASEFLTR